MKTLQIFTPLDDVKVLEREIQKIQKRAGNSNKTRCIEIFFL